MKKYLRLSVLCSMLFMVFAWIPLPAQAVDIDWTLLKQFQLNGKPLDIAASGDGKLFLF